MSIPIDQLPEPARDAWRRLGDQLQPILGEDLVAIWAYGSVVGSDRFGGPADLDTHVVLQSVPDASGAKRITEVCDAIARQTDSEWDVWFITLDHAQRAEHPRHAFLEGRRDTSWALHRAHWLAGRFVLIHGREPTEIVLAPTWSEVELDLDRELEHIERHVHEGDTNPHEAAYAILNGTRILHTIASRDIALSKREAGIWALDHLPERWHPAVQAAMRAYDLRASAQDTALLAVEMAPFVATVRQRTPRMGERPHDGIPRWSGY